MITFTSPTNGIIVGQGGRILKTTDGGNTWLIKNSGISDDLFTLHFMDANNGWAAGDFGSIIKTTDGGETWTDIATPNTTIISTIWFTNANKGWAAQMDGNLLYTTDGGNNWISDTSFSYHAMWTTCFTSPDTGFVAGNDGNMYKTSNGGTLNSINENNQQFSSKINMSVFPNPINSYAVIDYYLPQKALCISNLFDINGKLIQCFSNEIQDKGKHQMRINTDILENGVYFIELKTENHNFAQKVIVSHK